MMCRYADFRCANDFSLIKELKLFGYLHIYSFEICTSKIAHQTIRLALSLAKVSHPEYDFLLPLLPVGIR